MVDVLPLVHNRSQLVGHDLRIRGEKEGVVEKDNSNIVAMNDSLAAAARSHVSTK